MVAAGTPALNKTLEFGTLDAEAIWASAALTPVTESRHARRSADGTWVIRRVYTDPARLPADLAGEGLLDTAREEFQKLEDCDIDVIARGFALSPGGTAVYAISPWISDLEVCSVADFGREIRPKVRRYYEQATGRYALALFEIGKRANYSKHPSLSERPFLHDIDLKLKIINP